MIWASPKKDMSTSNLSKIKPKLRTEGVVSGNFGRAKVKAGSPMRDIGVTNAKTIKITTKEDYLKRLYAAHAASDDPKLKNFLFSEIKKILIQKGEWK